MKFNDWLADWLENYVKTASKQRTYERYTETVRAHILPKLGERDIRELTLIELQKFVTELLSCGNKNTGRGLSASTVNSVITIMQSSLRTAYHLGLITNDLSSGIKRPKVSEKTIECFSSEEQRKIERAVLEDNREYMFGVILCLYTGLRIGELLALTWADIDFREEVLSVTKTCYYDKDGLGNYVRVIDDPKTANSRRLVPLPKQLMPKLKDLRKSSKSEYIIAKADKPVSMRTYQRNFEVLLKKSCIPHRGFHALRHTFATRAIECGMDVKTLSEILGHKNATITLNRYAHSLIEHKKNMMNRLGNIYNLSKKI